MRIKTEDGYKLIGGEMSSVKKINDRSKRECHKAYATFDRGLDNPYRCWHTDEDVPPEPQPIKADMLDD